MSDLFDLSNFDKYKEDNCREVKKAEGGLPIALQYVGQTDCSPVPAIGVVMYLISSLE